MSPPFFPYWHTEPFLLQPTVLMRHFSHNFFASQPQNFRNVFRSGRSQKPSAQGSKVLQLFLFLCYAFVTMTIFRSPYFQTLKLQLNLAFFSVFCPTARPSDYNRHASQSHNSEHHFLGTWILFASLGFLSPTP